MADEQGDSQVRLTVRQAAALSGCHPQTVRKAIREGELKAEKTQGSHGPEWRIEQKDLESSPLSAKGESISGEPTLTQAHSRLVEIKGLLMGLLEAQKALPEPEEGRRERLERERGTQEALAEVAETVKAQAEEIAGLRAELAADREERQRGWWRRFLDIMTFDYERKD